jgi:hypothetical protein
LAVGHRVHEDDLFGHLLAQGGYDHLSLPMLATERERISRGGYTFQREPGDLLSPVRMDMRATHGLPERPPRRFMRSSTSSGLLKPPAACSQNRAS